MQKRIMCFKLKNLRTSIGMALQVWGGPAELADWQEYWPASVKATEGNSWGDRQTDLKSLITTAVSHGDVE